MVFDEGNEVFEDSTGGGLDLLLSANAKWGNIDVNNTAISKHSLNLMDGDASRARTREAKGKRGFFLSFLV